MTSKKPDKPSIDRYGEALATLFAKNTMVIFLCGPSLVAGTDAAKLRQRLKDELEKDKFEVVLGEDDGLEALRKQFSGIYAHDNELSFIQSECGAIVLIADSVGAYCELGLFAHIQVREKRKQRDFILIIDAKYKGAVSYLNEGPARAIQHFGEVHYEDFNSFDCSKVVARLRGRRAAYILDKRGRPRKRRPKAP